METIKVKVEESLLAEVDRVTRSLAITRDDFARIALELALRNQRTIALEQQHAQGYARHPVKPDECDEWESEQVWGVPREMREVRAAIEFSLGFDALQ